MSEPRLLLVSSVSNLSTVERLRALADEAIRDLDLPKTAVLQARFDAALSGYDVLPSPSALEQLVNTEANFVDLRPTLKNVWSKERPALADIKGGRKLPILLFPAEALRRRSASVAQVSPTRTIDEPADFGDEVRALVKNLAATAKAAKGSGLSAPQLGINKRVCVVEVDGEGSGKYVAFINPVITEWTSTEMVTEGCLSFPRAREKVERSTGVRGHALTDKGTWWEFDLTGIEAQTLQHEVEHLDGKLLVDNVPTHRRLSLMTAMKQMNRRIQRVLAVERPGRGPSLTQLVHGYEVD